MTIPQAFDLALGHHQAGRLADAEALYRRILAAQPNHADALHLLGLIAHQSGRHDLAVEWIGQSIVINPNNPASHSNLGEACRALGRTGQAIAAYRRALELKPDYPEALNNLGAALAGEDQLSEAVVAFHRALELRPRYPEALNNLGIALRRQGHVTASIAAFRRALEFEPAYPEALNSLGLALRDQGQLDDAVAAHRRALELKPNDPDALINLGATLASQNQSGEAMAAFRRALQLKPDSPEAHLGLGVALRERGQLDESIAAQRMALKLKPDYPEALINLGAALAGQGQFGEAIAAFRRALQIKPDYPETLTNLGAALTAQGQLDEAVAAHRRALELKPAYAEALTNLGAALAGQNRAGEAIAAYHRALQLKPDYPDCLNNLGNALKDQGDLDDAIAAYRRVIQIKPDCQKAHNNLGIALRDQGELDEAIAAIRQAIRINPDAHGTHSNLVFTLHFQPGEDHESISAEHRRWNRQFSEPLRPFIRPHPNDRNAERRLRVGYVSNDFREHPVGRYLLPLFECHDREQFDLVCFSEIAQPDWITERLRAMAGEWRSTMGISNPRLAEMVREDRVDILVDLGMHTSNRLPVFAWQPAPVQVSWLAYPGSAGVSGIGYRLTDSRMEPPGEDSARSAETPVRLPDCWCCYSPADDSPEINALPAWSAEGVTFGSLNNFTKVNEGVLALWARLLQAVAGSRLVMLCPKGRTRERVRAFLGARGIAAERVEWATFGPRWEYLSLYQRIDLGLDPFPCNGMTTTCDALWMGVPVLTLPGDMPASRAGLSLLSSIELGELAASSEEDYVRIAEELAGNLPRLADLRATLRPRMQASPLMDARRFARNVEAAYRSMWQSWCARPSPIPQE